MASDLDPVFDAAAKEWNIDPTLLRAVAAQESGSQGMGAVSPKGAQGTMQLLPATAQGLGVTDLKDPVQNIYAGAKYLSEALDKEGNVEDALRYYHGGPNWRQSYGPESQGYAPGITAKYAQLSKGQAAPKDDGGDIASFAAQTGAVLPGSKPAGAQPSKQDDTPDIASFAAQTGAVMPKAEAPQDANANEYGITGDPQQFNGGKPAPAQPTESPMGRVIGAAVQGAKEGYGDSAVGLPAEAQQKWADLGPVGDFVGRNIVSPIYGLGQVAMKDGNALLRGAQAGVAQLGAEAGAPQLGRDIAALPEAFPFGPGHEAGAPAAVAPKEAPKAIVREITPAELAAPRNKLLAAPADDMAPQAPANKLTGEPVPAQGTPAPNSVGAAASAADEAAMSPKETQAYRSMGEKEKLNEPQPTGQADPHAYVPGVAPNRAEIEQSVNTARELKALGTAHPEVSAEAKAVAAENNEARRQYFQQIAGSDVDVMNAKAARDAQAETDLAAAFGNKKDVSPQPVIDLAEQLKTSPDGKRPLVRSVIDSVTNELRDADGNLTTDPEQLYGVRKHIDDLLSREANAGDQKNLRAAAQLQQIKQALDGVIEQGAPGFRQYLDNFSQASRPIEAMEALQKFENKLYTGSDRRMGYNQVQNMMRQIVEARQAPGINPFKSIPDDMMQKLWNLRDDLRRSASAQELARAPGSDTAQNFADLMRLGGNAAVHAGANMLAPGVGSLAVGAVKQGLSPILAGRANRKAVSRGVEMLHPKTPLRNPLLEP